MSTFYTLLTAIGAADFINAQAAGITVPFTHLALGDGNGAAMIPLESMTTLKREVHRVPISSVTADDENPSWLVIEAVVPTAVGGWTVREIGLIGGSGVGGKLLAIGNFPDTYKPVLSEGSGRDLVVRMIVQVGNASVVQLTVDPSVAVATNQAIVNAVAAHEVKSDPHPQYIKSSQKGAANGVASLGSDGLVPLAQLPPAIATDTELAASLAAHVSAADPHTQYIKSSQKGAANGVASLGSDGLVPLAQLPPAIATDTELAASLAAHVSAADPHTQYIKSSQKGAANGVASLGSDGLVPLSQLPPAIATDTELAASLAAHVSTADPHPQYVTVAELNAVLDDRKARRHYFAHH